MNHNKELEDRCEKEERDDGRPTSPQSRPTRSPSQEENVEEKAQERIHEETKENKTPSRSTPTQSRPTASLQNEEPEKSETPSRLATFQSQPEDTLIQKEDSVQKEADATAKKDKTQGDTMKISNHINENTQKEAEIYGGPNQLCSKSIESMTINPKAKKPTQHIYTANPTRVDRPSYGRPTYSASYGPMHYRIRGRQEYSSQGSDVHNLERKFDEEYEPDAEDIALRKEEFDTTKEIIRQMFKKRRYDDCRKNPLHHLEKFEEVINQSVADNHRRDELSLKLFKYTLEGGALLWFERLDPRRIANWRDTKKLFIEEFLVEPRRRITEFIQSPGETFNEAWRRHTDHLRSIPRSFSHKEVLSTFYDGLIWENQVILDLLGQGNFEALGTKDGFKTIEKYARSKSANCPKDAMPTQGGRIQERTHKPTTHWRGEPYQRRSDEQFNTVSPRFTAEELELAFMNSQREGYSGWTTPVNQDKQPMRKISAEESESSSSQSIQRRHPGELERAATNSRMARNLVSKNWRDIRMMRAVPTYGVLRDRSQETISVLRKSIDPTRKSTDQLHYQQLRDQPKIPRSFVLLYGNPIPYKARPLTANLSEEMSHTVPKEKEKSTAKFTIFMIKDTPIKKDKLKKQAELTRELYSKYTKGLKEAKEAADAFKELVEEGEQPKLMEKQKATTAAISVATQPYAGTGFGRGTGNKYTSQMPMPKMEWRSTTRPPANPTFSQQPNQGKIIPYRPPNIHPPAPPPSPNPTYTTTEVFEEFRTHVLRCIAILGKMDENTLKMLEKVLDIATKNRADIEEIRSYVTLKEEVVPEKMEVDGEVIEEKPTSQVIPKESSPIDKDNLSINEETPATTMETTENKSKEVPISIRQEEQHMQTLVARTAAVIRKHVEILQTPLTREVKKIDSLIVRNTIDELTFSCTIRKKLFPTALVISDNEANIVPYSTAKAWGHFSESIHILKLPGGTEHYPSGTLRNVTIKVYGLTIGTDFEILQPHMTIRAPFILGKPFLLALQEEIRKDERTNGDQKRKKEAENIASTSEEPPT